MWNREVKATTTNEIREAINDENWQRFRLSLKGLSTEAKLRRLDAYVSNREVTGRYNRVEQVRIDNYINALLRGGQLKRVGRNIVIQR